MEIGKFKQAKSYLTRPARKPQPEQIIPKQKPYTEGMFKEEADLFLKGFIGGFPQDEMLLKLQAVLDKAVEKGVVEPEAGLDYFRSRKQELLDFARENPGETLPRVNKAIGGGVVEGENLGTREGFQDPKIELHRSKGVLGNLNYGFDNLSKDLKAGKTTNQIANELYEKNKNFPEKFKTDRIQKLNPVTLLEVALKDRIRKQPDFSKLSDKNQKAFNFKKEKALKDFNSFIEKNKSKYKKMYDQNIAGAPEKFKQDLKSFLEKKYPEFIKESGGGTFITKGTKLFTPIKDLGREVTQAGDYGIEKYINNTIRESLGIPLKPKAGEGSSLDRLQRKYNLSTRQLLDVAKKQGVIPENDPITGNPINSEDAYYRYVKRTEVDPIYNLFDKRFKFGAEHLGGISRAANIGDPQALTKITAMDPYVNRVLKGSNLDKKVSTQINLAKETGNKKYLNIANDLIKQGEKDFGLQLTKYKFKDNKIVPVHPKVSMDDPIVKKAERAIKSFIATGRDKTKEFELLPEDLKQSIQLFKENNLPKARKFLNQAIKTGGVASVAGIAGLGLLGTEAEAAGEETKKGSILPEAAAASSLALKPVREGAKKFGKYALQVAGTPLGATGLIAGFGVDPTQTLDRVGIEAEAALAPELVKQSAKFGPAAQRILNFGLSPAMAARAARIASPIGIASLGGEALYKYGKFVKDELDRIEKMSPEEREAYNIEQQEQMGVAAANGGLIRKGFANGPEDPSKRKFMKIMGGLASLPIVGKFFDVAQVAEKAAPAVVETFKNAPPHFMGLVNKIRALGKIVEPEKLMPSDQKRYSNVYDYGDYRMFEGKDGQVEIAKDKFMATDYGDAKVSEEYMSYNPKSPKIGKKGELTGETEPQYDEYTAYSDQDGKMKDVYDGIEESTKMDGTYSKEELEQLIIEQVEQNLKKGKK
jgi:hypothetical protein